MKIIVELAFVSVIIIEGSGLKDLKEFYNKYYKDKGFLYSDEAESIYYEVDSPIMPIEGQRLGSKFGMVIVDWTYFNIDGDSDDYFEKTRIVVIEE